MDTTHLRVALAASLRYNRVTATFRLLVNDEQAKLLEEVAPDIIMEKQYD